MRLTAQNLRNARLGLGAIHVRATPDPGVSFKLTARPIGNLIKGSFTEVGTAAGLTGNRSERFQCTSGTVRFTLHG